MYGDEHLVVIGGRATITSEYRTLGAWRASDDAWDSNTYDV